MVHTHPGRTPAARRPSRRLPAVAGRIREEDIAAVRERVDLAEVVGEYVALRPAGGGSLKGLCPFHDEKTPSFNVHSGRGFFHCFGCSEGGDVFDFLQKVESLSFAEAVERLAGRVQVELHYEGGGVTPGRQQGLRTRLVEAHRAAADYYVEQLNTAPDAAAGRRFLAERGFDRDAVARFGVGYAPRGWDLLTRPLRGRGFTEAELRTGGLSSDGTRGRLIDRFRGRLVWPIRDVAGDVIGFGARRLHDDDSGPKYLNTIETPLYKKSTVLYGVDLARREIARRMQAVVVEGYTDVMACHLSGVETAVATCGTVFGEEHARLLRRLLHDQSELRGEVIFTFDGDEAGRRAALKAMDHDVRFVAQTFVAVSPDGLDPCELREKKGPEAVRDLVASRLPLVEFAVRSIVDRYDLLHPAGRVAALHAAAPVLAHVKDRSLRPEYARLLAGWLGLDVESVAEEVARAARRSGAAGASGDASRPGPDGAPRPDLRDPELLAERETLKVALQSPALAGRRFDALDRVVFTAPPYAAVHAAIVAAGGTASGLTGEAWLSRVHAAAVDDRVRRLVTELAVEPPRADPVDTRYAGSLMARVEELAVTRRIVEVKARLQRLNPVEQVERYNPLFGELVALEQHRRALREQGSAAGPTTV